MSAVGDVVDGRYRLERRLGEGVFLADDLPLARAVVVRLADAAGAEALARQATVLRSVQFATTHVVPVIDEGATAGGGRYLVAPVIDGIPLERLAASAPIDPDRVCQIGEGLLEAAEAARRVFPGGAGAMPASAILDRDNQVRVIRFSPAEAGDDDVTDAVAAVLHRLATGVDPEPGVPAAEHGRLPSELGDVIDAGLAGELRTIGGMRRRLAAARRRMPRR